MLGLANLLGAYFLMHVVPRKYVGWTIVLYSLSTTAAAHIERMIRNYGGWDTTVAQCLMMQVISLSYMGWDYTDGLNPECKSRTKINELPTLIEFLGSTLSPTQVLAGPAGHLTDFLNYVNNRGEYAQKYDVLIPGLKKVLTGFLWLIVYGSIVNFFPFDLLYTTQFSEADFLHRTMLFLIMGEGVKSRYYVAFKLCEAAVTFSGQAFNGYDEKRNEKHDKLRMIDIPCTETSVFLRSIIEEWHIPIHLWLKNCIHMRINGNSQVKIFITFFVSAAWHGFYPLYFGSFLFYSVGTVNFNFMYKMFVIHKSLRKPIFYIIQSYF